MIQVFGRFRPRFPKTLCAVVLSTALLISAPGHADEPYARSRDYDLQNVKTHLWFDTDQRKVRGEVTHSLSMFRDGLAQIKFDSVDLNIQAVTLDGRDAKFSVTPNNLIVQLATPSKRGDK